MTEDTDKELVKRWVRPAIRELSAYHVQEAEGLIKLDAMENPYRWPEALREEWLGLLRAAEVNRYPHPQSPGVKAALRESMAIPAEADLILGNGSDELIQMIAMTLGGTGRTILSVEPSFVMYRMIATFLGMGYVGVPLRADGFSLDLEAMLTAVEHHRPAVVFLAYPNNPTGNLFDRAALMRIIEVAPGLVVVDEAYAPFTDASFLQRLGRHDNLVVMRTLSKMGLAGLRLGLLAGPAAWLGEIEKTRLPYNINILTQLSVAFALRHREVFDTQTTAIRVARDEMFEAFRARKDMEPFPSEANFILLRLTRGSAVDIHGALRDRGVLLKLMHGSHPLLENCLRVTVGTNSENQAMLEAFDEVLKGRGPRAKEDS